MGERRRLRRIPAKECFVECCADSFWNFLKKPSPDTFPMVDISEGGCQIAATSGMALGLSVRLQLIVPKEPKPVEVYGKVAWTKRSSAKNRDETWFAIGIKFVRFPAKERDRFQTLLLTKRFEKATGAPSTRVIQPPGAAKGS